MPSEPCSKAVSNTNPPKRLQNRSRNLRPKGQGGGQRYDEFYAVELMRSAHYALFLKRIVERNYWLLSDGTLPVNGKQTSLIQSVSRIYKIDNVDVEKMFQDWVRECDFKESDELSIKDMVFLFNSIRNRH